MTPRRSLIFLLAACLAPIGCGYHVSGHADLVPANIKSICVPAFGNITTRYKLTDRLASAVGREFISRSRYRIVPDPNQADAILTGAVINVVSLATTFDTTTGRASGVQVIVTLQVKLVERSTGKILYSRPNFDVRERYEISTKPETYFEESDTALDRLSTDVARMVVSAILENF